jgi:hypothetical protein
VLIEKLDQFREVGKRARQSVDLVYQDNVDLAGANVVEQSLQGRAVQGCAGQTAIVIMVGDEPPAFMGLALYIGVCTENLIRVDDVVESPKLAG